jgi:hypothetical protein
MHLLAPSIFMPVLPTIVHHHELTLGSFDHMGMASKLGPIIAIDP